jgi:hypothetical protein
VADDRIPGLMWRAVRAARRRYDRPVVVRAAMVAWLGAIAASPRPLAEELAELFVFPERRQRLMPTAWRRRRSRRGQADKQCES